MVSSIAESVVMISASRVIILKCPPRASLPDLMRTVMGTARDSRPDILVSSSGNRFFPRHPAQEHEGLALGIRAGVVRAVGRLGSAECH